MCVCRSMLAFLVASICLRPVFLTKLPFLPRVRKTIKVEYVEDCDQKSYPIRLQKSHFGRNGSDLIISGEAIITRDIKNPLQLQYRIEKCRDKLNPDTCEYYTTWKWDDMCAALQLPFVKVFKEGYTPPLDCPLKKNHYYMKNVRLPTDMMEMFLAHGDTNVLWKFRMKMFEEMKVMVACSDFGFGFVTTRVRM